MHVAAITIGQTPRPDLLQAWSHVAGVQISLLGALDGADIDALPEPAPGGYPLVTSLSSGTRSGERITVDEAVLTPFVQRAIERAESAQPALVILLCAGEFAGLRCASPLIRPFDLVARLLELRGGGSDVIIVVPTDAQRAPAERKWSARGFRPTAMSIESVPPSDVPSAVAETVHHSRAPRYVIFDYVGYPVDVIRATRERVDIPVFDLGHASVRVVQSLTSSI